MLGLSQVKSMGVLGFIYHNLDHFRPRFLAVLVIGVLDGLATFFIPISLAEFTKSSFTINNFQRLIFFIALFYLASLIFQRIIRRYGEALGPQFANYMRLKYFKALESQSFQKLTAHHSGYILSLVNRVADGFTPILVDIFWTFAKSSSNIILFFFFTARESIAVAFINLIVLCLFLAASVILSRKMIPLVNEMNQKRAKLMERYVDFMANILTIKKLGIVAFAQKQLSEKTLENYNQINKIQNFHANRWFFLHSLFNLALLSTIGFLLWQIANGNLTPSILILFVAAYTVVQRNVERLSENFVALMEMKAYIDNLDAIIAAPIVTEAGRQIESWQTVSFAGVSFQYPETSRKITIPKFSIRRGEKVCIIGKSGEGKTTFLNLLINLLQPDGGSRLVDDVAYNEIDSAFFKDQMTIITQEVELFNLPLRENLTLGQPISDERLWELLKRVDLWQWAKGLENGLDTVVGEKGVKLSSGQKQRINLLRGILLNRSILLLDEPTSHLDLQTEQKVVTLLVEYLVNKTAIIVSHRPTLKALCSRSYTIKDHVLIEDY